MNRLLSRRNFFAQLSSSCLIFTIGCGTSNKRHSLRGRVRWAHGELASLEGHQIELADTTDPTIRASGLINADGSFQVDALVEGQLRSGTSPGTYQARVVFADEGDGQRKKPAIPARYLRFETSGWHVTVPSPQEIELTLTAK